MKKRSKILFVCSGNVCRSPMAEVIFSNLCKRQGRGDIIVKGAGTGAREGEEMTREAREALKACGERISRKNITSKCFVNSMVGEYDWIITMTRAHSEYIGRHHLNVACLDDFTGCGNIMDPWMYPLDVYIDVCKKLQTALNVLYIKIIK